VFGENGGGTADAADRDVAAKPIARILLRTLPAPDEPEPTREWEDDDPTIDESATFESETPTERYPWRHISTFTGALTTRGRN
jgi:hypothetical protein